MTAMTVDPFAKFKEAQREGWSSFVPVEIMTTTPAAKLVKFAQVKAGQHVLDVACGTGVVAITAARRGARVSGLDLTPALIERARENAASPASSRLHRGRCRGVALSRRFVRRRAQPVRPHVRAASGRGDERDAASAQARRTDRVFDLAARALLGRMFAFVARNMPPPPAGAEQPAAPPLWGEPEHHPRAARLGGDRPAVRSRYPGRAGAEHSAFPRRAGKDHRSADQACRRAAERAGKARRSCAPSSRRWPARFYEDNAIHASFLMTRAIKA